MYRASLNFPRAIVKVILANNTAATTATVALSVTAAGT
jgi:hypothetical protein